MPHKHSHSHTLPHTSNQRIMRAINHTNWAFSREQQPSTYRHPLLNGPDGLQGSALRPSVVRNASEIKMKLQQIAAGALSLQAPKTRRTNSRVRVEIVIT
ncbi:uncharacterized protein BO97DRAFT_402229, partial [Aspergillus homomorphus CBS 101889]